MRGRGMEKQKVSAARVWTRREGTAREAGETRGLGGKISEGLEG